MEEKTFSVYGNIVDPEWEKQRQIKEYTYLEALINAEKLNPEQDWEGERRYELMKKIAQSDLSVRPDRNKLISLLEKEESDD